MNGMGITLSGVIVFDNVAEKHYGFHAECWQTAQELLGNLAVPFTPEHRMVAMGPGADGQVCNLATCQQEI